MYKRVPKSLTQSQILHPPAKQDIFIEPYAFVGVSNATTEFVDDRKLASRTSDHKISRITIMVDDSRCWGLQVHYKVPGKSQEVTNGPSIGIKAPMEVKCVHFEFDDDEYLTEIYGATGRGISEIGFRTSKGKCMTNGCPDIDANLFKLHAPPDHHYKMLIAGSGDNLQYIGAEIRPIIAPQTITECPKLDLRKNYFADAKNKMALMRQSAPKLGMRSSMLMSQTRLSQFRMTQSRIIPSRMTQSRIIVKVPAENPYFKGKTHPLTARENASQLLAMPFKTKISKVKVSFNNTYLTALKFSHQTETESEVVSRGVASSLVDSASVEEIFELETDEYLTEISGTLTEHIMSFSFETSRGRKEGPFGNVEGKSFKMRAPEGFHFYVAIVGAGEHIHNIEGKVAPIPVEHLDAPKLLTSPIRGWLNLPLTLPLIGEIKEQLTPTPVKVIDLKPAEPKILTPVQEEKEIDLNPQVAPCPSEPSESMKSSYVVSFKNTENLFKFDEKEKFLSGKDIFKFDEKPKSKDVFKFDERPDKFMFGKDAFMRDNCFKERM